MIIQEVLFFNSLTSQNIYFMFNGSTNLGMSSTSATFYNNVFINGATTLNNALYIYVLTMYKLG